MNTGERILKIAKASAEPWGLVSATPLAYCDNLSNPSTPSPSSILIYPKGKNWCVAIIINININSSSSSQQHMELAHRQGRVGGALRPRPPAPAQSCNVLRFLGAL